MSGEGLSAEEHLDVLKDEIFYATDRLSPSEARAVAHAVYNGDWLARRESEAAEKALRDVADAWTQGQWSDAMLPKPTPPAVPVIAYSNRVGDWLRARADSVAQGREETP